MHISKKRLSVIIIIIIVAVLISGVQTAREHSTRGELNKKQALYQILENKIEQYGVDARKQREKLVSLQREVGALGAQEEEE